MTTSEPSAPVVVEVLAAAADELAERVAPLFAQHLGAIVIEARSADPADAAAFGALVTRYTKLMNAALSPRLAIEAEADAAAAGRDRGHARLHWPIATRLRSAYSLVALVARDATAFLPAVAVDGRMVLVPLAQRDALGDPHGGSETPASFVTLWREVLEVDFAGDADLTRAIAAASDSVLEERLRERTASSGSGSGSSGLAFRVRPQTFTCGEWTAAVLEAVGATAAGSSPLAVEVSGPVDVRPRRTTLRLVRSRAVEAAIKLRPRERGEFPLEIFCLRRDGAFVADVPWYHIWLESG